MRTIELTEQLPRMLENSMISFNYGFVLQQVLLYFFVFGSLQIALTILFLIIFRNNSLFYLVPFLIMLLVGFLSYREIKNIKQKIATRKEVYVHGKPIKASVIGHSREMVYYKSERDYMLHIQLMDSSKRIKLRCKNSNVFKQYPKGSEIIGLQYGSDLLFGPAVNAVFVWND